MFGALKDKLKRFIGVVEEKEKKKEESEEVKKVEDWKLNEEAKIEEPRRKEALREEIFDQEKLEEEILKEEILEEIPEEEMREEEAIEEDMREEGALEEEALEEKALEEAPEEEVRVKEVPKKEVLKEEIHRKEVHRLREIKELKPMKKPGKSKKEEKKREVKLTKTSQLFGLFRRTIRFSENDLQETFNELQMDLLQSDVAFETTDAIIGELKSRLVDKEINKNDMHNFIKNSIHETLFDILKTERVDILKFIGKSEKPVKIIFFGINGTGKTTTIAKFAKYLMNNGVSVVLAAGDTFRAGAIEQLELHGSRLGVKVIKHQKGADAAATIFDAVDHAKARNIDVILADTAGRMQTNTNLMSEMNKIIRVNKPDLKIFVGDSLTGNDAVEQARTFNDSIGIDGVILTKMDADAKGGCAISIAYEIKKPIMFVGVGQEYEDLMEFDNKWFVGEIV